MTLNMRPICCGEIAVPSHMPSDENAVAPSRAMRAISPPWATESPGIGPMMRRATSNTTMAAMIAWITPATIFSAATTPVGTGARSRSSISRVQPKSCTIGNETA